MLSVRRSEPTSIFGTNDVICRAILSHLSFLPYQFSTFDVVEVNSPVKACCKVNWDYILKVAKDAKRDAESLSTLEFYGKSYDDLRAESVNSLKQLWSRLNLMSSRVEKIGDSIEQLQRYSFQYNIKIIGLPESETH